MLLSFACLVGDCITCDRGHPSLRFSCGLLLQTLQVKHGCHWCRRFFLQEFGSDWTFSIENFVSKWVEKFDYVQTPSGKSLGLKDKARELGVNSFELKLFRLTKSTGAYDCQNHAIYTQEQWDLERPLLLESSESELNSKGCSWNAFDSLECLWKWPSAFFDRSVRQQSHFWFFYLKRLGGSPVAFNKCFDFWEREWQGRERYRNGSVVRRLASRIECLKERERHTI